MMPFWFSSLENSLNSVLSLETFFNVKIKHFKFPEKLRRKYIKNCGYDFSSTFFKVCFLELHEKNYLPI